MVWWQAALQADTGGQQVSILVPFVVALISAVAIIGGHVINARREDRRWRREQDREDRRWQRERDREDQRWQRERDREDVRWQRDLHREAETRAEANKTHWRDKKFEMFAELFSAVDRWETLISIAVETAHADKLTSQEMRDDLSKIREECLVYDLQVSLLMIDLDARDILTSAIETIEAYSTDITEGKPGSKSPGEIMIAISRAIGWVITSIRLDLGIANDQDRLVLRDAGITDQKEGTQ